MAATFTSAWYRVEGVRPRLRTHVKLMRQSYRGVVWHVLHDLATNRFHRIGAPAYVVIGLMDGRRTAREIWEAAGERLGEDAPAQHDLVRLLAQLHAAELLMSDRVPDIAAQRRRRDTQDRRVRVQRLTNLFSWRLPLGDPDRLLDRIRPVVKPLIGWTGLVMWSVAVVTGVVLAALHWDALSRDAMAHVLTTRNLLTMWLLFPVIKLFHEFGHAITTKAFGGEVHEAGIMCLVVTPVPYVDATTAWSFKNKWQRIVVGAAGMMVELFAAALALAVWVAAEPGLVRIVAYNVVLIAGISTVLFNANPLLRFDGYYMLMDFLEVPNLRSRASKYFAYLTERYLLGQRNAEEPVATAGERAWFIGYGVAAAVYRIVVVVGILLVLGQAWPLAGLLFGVLTAVTMLLVPMGQAIWFLVAHPRLQPVRLRAITTSLALVVVLSAVIGLLPVPQHSSAEGVVWLPDESFVRPASDGFVRRVVVQPGTPVDVGDVLIVLEHPRLSADLAVKEARLRELRARWSEQQPIDRVKAAILDEEIRVATSERNRAQERVDGLTVRSRARGTFVVEHPQDLPGRFVRQGQLVGHVIEFNAVTVRAVISQQRVSLVRDDLRGTVVRLAERVDSPIPASVTRLVPGATEHLPHPALGTEGGGDVPSDPNDSRHSTDAADATDPQDYRALERSFEAELLLPAALRTINAGARVHVRFEHTPAPLAHQWARDARQLFLAWWHA